MFGLFWVWGFDCLGSWVVLVWFVVACGWLFVLWGLCVWVDCLVMGWVCVGFGYLVWVFVMMGFWLCLRYWCLFGFVWCGCFCYLVVGCSLDCV